MCFLFKIDETVSLAPIQMVETETDTMMSYNSLEVLCSIVLLMWSFCYSHCSPERLLGQVQCSETVSKRVPSKKYKAQPVSPDILISCFTVFNSE